MKTKKNTIWGKVQDDLLVQWQQSHDDAIYEQIRPSILNLMDLIWNHFRDRFSTCRRMQSEIYQYTESYVYRNLYRIKSPGFNYLYKMVYTSFLKNSQLIQIDDARHISLDYLSSLGDIELRGGISDKVESLYTEEMEMIYQFWLDHSDFFNCYLPSRRNGYQFCLNMMNNIKSEKGLLRTHIHQTANIKIVTYINWVLRQYIDVYGYIPQTEDGLFVKLRRIIGICKKQQTYESVEVFCKNLVKELV